MLFIKYICSVIALISTLLFISSIISDITIPSSVKALQMNMPEDDIINTTSAIRIILIFIMSLTWPFIFLF